MRTLLLTAVGLASAALLTGPALASPCVTASVGTYEAAGFSCSVDNGAIVFSNISVSTLGIVTLGNFTPFNSGNEWGLSLNYAANTDSSSTQADVAWQYNVSASPPMVDAYAAFTATATGTGTATLSETLSNGIILSLTGPGATTATFDPVSNLFVIKDQNDFAGTAGSSESSILSDGFSLATTPIPGTLPLLAGGLLGLFAIRRKRKQKAIGGRLESALA